MTHAKKCMSLNIYLRYQKLSKTLQTLFTAVDATVCMLDDAILDAANLY